MVTKFKTGMLPWSTEQIKLKFHHYLNRKDLPLAPKRFGHVHSDELSMPWGMLANDQYGDCTMAGIAHGQMVWDWANRKQLPKFTDDVIVKQYMELTEGMDTGLDPVTVADYWKVEGLEDSVGNKYHIKAYAAINTPSDLIESAFLFGFAGLGVWLPDNAIKYFEAAHPWIDTSLAPNQHAGHFVPVVGRNSAGNIMVVTWGRLHAITPEWLAKYFAGGIAYISEDYFNEQGMSPEGFNFDQLNADLAQLSA